MTKKKRKEIRKTEEKITREENETIKKKEIGNKRKKT